MKFAAWFDQLSLREQCGFLTGSDAWHTASSERVGIPGIHVSDGPTGLRTPARGLGRDPAESVCFPTEAAMASSWDTESARTLGETLGRECRARRIDVLLGPGANIKRSPLCGRNFEYFSEDPLVSGEMASAVITGVQSQNVGTSLKHFACNNTETARMKADSIVDDRALREIYLKPFQLAVEKAKPWTVMASYNKINEKYSTENSWLLSDVLRKEWGFDGAVISDWNAVNNRAAALKAGLDLDMPGTGNYTPQTLLKAYRKDELTLEDIQTSTSRIFELIHKAEENQYELPPEDNMDADHDVAAHLAEGCPVLLKNDHHMLPVNPKRDRVAVIGARAKEPLYQGGGSSGVKAHHVVSPYECLQKECTYLTYTPGYDLDNLDVVSDVLLKNAKDAAKSADKVLVFVSCNERDVTEGMDRQSLKLPEAMNALVDAVTSVSMNVAVVLTTGSAVELPWVSKPAAILQTYLLGEGVGEAVSRILLGYVSPSGKLAESYPVHVEDVPGYKNLQPDEHYDVLYKESIYVGYRYYEKAHKEVLFPFGYGLSYSEFSYNNLILDKEELTPDDTLTLTFEITNHGMPAAEVPQVYVGYRDIEESYIYRPVKELVAFSKVFLDSNETQTATLTLDHTAFEYYSSNHQAWQIEPGEYDIYIGSASDDIRLMGHVTMKNDAFGDYDYRARTPDYFSGNVAAVDDEEFDFVLGYHLEDFVSSSKRVTRDSCLADVQETEKGARLVRALNKLLKRQKDPLKRELLFTEILYTPFNRFCLSSRGAISEDKIDALVLWLNGGEVTDALKLCLLGLPDELMNIALPAGQKLAWTVPQELVPAKIKKLGRKKKSRGKKK